MKRVQLFIDGFNLYHSIMGIQAFRGYRWLNFRQLGDHIISSREEIESIYFFTAFYPGESAKRLRHQTFIRAQQAFGVTTVLGEFRRKHKHCAACGRTTLGYEEKETDVNIAIYLLKNAMHDLYDNALIVSGDSDLIPAIRAVKELFTEKEIRIVFPPGSASEHLKLEADSYMRLKEKHLRDNQLPDPVTKDGVSIQKPVEW